MSNGTNIRPAGWRWWRDQQLLTAWRWFVLSGVIGVIGGVGAIVFYYLSAGLSQLCLVGLAGYEAGGPAHEPTVFQGLIHGPGSVILVALVLLPTIGNFLAGWLVQKYAPGIGHGTDAALDAYHNQRGSIPLRHTIAAMFASALTLGTGGSGGREGPIAQVGAGFGSAVGRWLGMRPMERRVLLAAGLAAGVGAIFRAPLAAGLFAAEILYRDSEFESEVLVPAVMSSILSYCIFSLVTGDFGELFTLGEVFVFDNPLDLLPYLVLTIVVVIAGILWVRIYTGAEWLAAKATFIPKLAMPAIGGALTGLVGVGLFLFAAWQFSGGETGPVAHAALSVLSYGYGLLQGLVDPAYAAHHNLVTLEAGAGVLIPLLLLIAIGKMITTSLTICSGGSAGVFGPSMVIGGALGGAVGVFFHAQGLADHPAPFIILGMAAFFAGVAKTPISTVIMVAELTGSYRLLIPAVWVCTLAVLLLGRNRAVLYRKQPLSRAESPAHRGDFMIDIFRGLTVADLVPRRLDAPHTINERRTLSDFVPEIIQTSHTYFPVVDDENRLKGILSLNDIRTVLYDESLGALVTALDVATVNVIRLRTGDDLSDALANFAARGFELLPVVDDSDDTKLLGMLSRRALLAEYTERLHALRRQSTDESRVTERRAAVKPDGTNTREDRD